MPNTIEIERLCLRKYQLGDEVSLFETYFSNIEATRFLQRLPHLTIQQTRNVLEKWADHYWTINNRDFAWVISDTNTQVAMGVLYFISQENHGEIHFGIGRKFQKQGYMVEALIGVIGYLKQNHVTKVVSSFCAEEHLASQSVLIKAGFKQNKDKTYWAKFPMLGDQLYPCFTYRMELGDCE
ncbi:GNAT family N-acetyltransferase [Acinetobacter sp. ANC 5054]|uniref:GNAT family N-acetyltransferase n=1 Tax=Acinetobacter sp. ANC 5054 TaxID=1977877 RepID=UPI00148A4A3A|nr:GNAT family N-acetyltransferase [Acinetobacter sp. ANC 5054]